MSTETYFEDLNTLFARCVQAGIASDMQVRVVVTEQASPKIGFRVVVLVDYRPNSKARSEATYYAVAAVVLFEGLPRRSYSAHCDAARRAKPQLVDHRKRDAEALAAKCLIADSRAVCVFRDELVLEHLRQAENNRYEPFDSDAINLLASMPVFGGDRDLQAVHGPITPEMLQRHIDDSIAKNMTCVRHSAFESWVQAGPHPSRLNTSAA